MRVYKFAWLLYTATLITFMYFELKDYELHKERKHAVALAAFLFLFIDVWRFLIRA